MGIKDTVGKASKDYRDAQPTFTDTLRGYGRVLRRDGLAGGMSPFKIRKAAKQVRAERAFGSGDERSGGNRNWTPPVHATTSNGRPITVSFGRGARSGDYLVADGHVGMSSFYSVAKAQGHDHFAGGRIVKDRGASS